MRIKNLQLRRNGSLFDNRAAALEAIKTQFENVPAEGEYIYKRGEPILAVYTEEGAEKIILGIKGQGGYQIIEGATLDESGNVDVPTSVQTAITAAIEALDVPAEGSAEDGNFVTLVSQEDGRVAVTRAAVAADKVTAEAIESGDATVAVAGDTVAAQIANIAKTIKGVKNDAEDAKANTAKYTVVALTAEEIAALADGANVKEAFKVVSYVGDEATAAKTQVGEPIKIYKDSALKSAALSGDNQKLVLTYTLANGADESVEVDFAAIAFNAEFKDGLAVNGAGEIRVKVADDSEKFGENEAAAAILTVGENGLKVSGVKDAIDGAVTAAIEKLDVTDAAVDGEFVTAVSEADGKITVSRTAVGAEKVTLAEVKDATDDTVKLAATDVQAGIAELFAKMLENEEVAAKALAALAAVMGADAINKDGVVGYNYTGTANVLKGVKSFTEADHALASAIDQLRADMADGIDCGEY